MNRTQTTRLLRPALAALAAAVLLLPGALLAGDKPYQKIKTPKLHDIVVPPVTRLATDNGLQLFVLEDHELPLFRLTLTMKVGDAYSPKEKRGLASITAEVLRSGGSESLSGDQMDEQLESMGGSIEVGVDELTTSLSINVLVEDSDKALQMMQDLLLHPAYPQDKLDLALTQMRSSIARRNDDPQQIGQRESAKVLYGPEHPFAAQVEYKHLATIGREDLLAFHRSYYHPTDCFVAVWGDFKTDEIVARIRSILGVWPRIEVRHPAIPPVPETTPSINLVVKESVNQSNIYMGHRGTTAKDPDYFALSVMNEILGGSFGSRLFNEVRSRQGLSYHVGSSLGAGLEYPQMFEIACGTKSQTTVQAIRSCSEEARKIRTQPVTAEELQRAKDGILNSFVFNFANKGAIVNRQMTYVRTGYPADFLEQYAKGIEKVTIEDVQRAAEKYVHPDRFAVLVVGKPADFDEPLAALGTVRTLDITIPEPPSTETYAAPTPESLAKGKQVLAEAARAVGGVDQLAKIDNLTETADLTLSMMGQSMPGKTTRYMQYPGNMRIEISIMGQKMVQVYNGAAKSGFSSGPQGAKDFEDKELEEAQEDLARDMIEFLRNAAAYAPQSLGEAEVNGAPADVILMTPATGKKFKVYVDRKTRFVVKEEHQGRNFQGAPVKEELFQEDFRKVGTILVPHKRTVLQDGKPFISTGVTSVLLTDIPPDKFKKSAS